MSRETCEGLIRPVQEELHLWIHNFVSLNFKWTISNFNIFFPLISGLLYVKPIQWSTYILSWKKLCFLKHF
jgi:hypothetical protein